MEVCEHECIRNPKLQLQWLQRVGAAMESHGARVQERGHARSLLRPPTLLSGYPLLFRLLGCGSSSREPRFLEFSRPSNPLGARIEALWLAHSPLCALALLEHGSIPSLARRSRSSSLVSISPIWK